MFTRNMYAFLRSTMVSSSVLRGTLPAMTVTGVPIFLSSQFGKFPYSRDEGMTTDANAAGITLGRGATPPTESDWRLESPITGDVSATVTARNVYVEGGDLCLRYSITVTNTGSSSLTLAEIGYKQTVRASAVANGTSDDNRVVLLDRTLIEPAITLPAGGATVINYVLRSSAEPVTVNGVKVVAWQHGTGVTAADEEVAAMIDAARAGTIDLVSDGGWRVGDMRTVPIASFVDGSGATHAATSVDLVITSFDEYRGCGNLMQLDFAESLPSRARMNPSNSNFGGYGLSEMCTATLPALADAMPRWIRDRMLTFSVLASAGENSSRVVEVDGNRLALRSEVEIFGGTPGSYAGEGTLVPWYQRVDELRKKRRGRTGGVEWWWTRSPSKDLTRFRTCDRNGNANYADASNQDGQITPFLCV